MKLTKAQLLSFPHIKDLYQKYIMTQKGSGRKQAGKGIFDGFVSFLKDTKILSKIGDVVLPLGGAALAGLLSANPVGAAVGAAAGSSANEFLKSKGFGGQTFGYNGIPQTIGSGRHTMMKMKGRGTEYGQVQSQFGKVKF